MIIVKQSLGKVATSDFYPITQDSSYQYVAKNSSEQTIMFKFAQRFGNDKMPSHLNINEFGSNEQALISSYVEYFGDISPIDYCRTYSN